MKLAYNGTFNDEKETAVPLRQGSYDTLHIFTVNLTSIPSSPQTVLVFGRSTCSNEKFYVHNSVKCLIEKTTLF